MIKTDTRQHIDRPSYRLSTTPAVLWAVSGQILWFIFYAFGWTWLATATHWISLVSQGIILIVLVIQEIWISTHPDQQ